MNAQTGIQKRAPGAPPALALGAMNFGKRTPAGESERIVRRALERGVTRLRHGQQLQRRGVRAHPRVARSGGIATASRSRPRRASASTPAGPRVSRPRPCAARSQASLERLGTDHVDIYYLHVPDRATPIEKTLDGVAELVASGRVRAWGVSNYASWEVLEMRAIAEARGLGPPVVTQLLYNVLHRELDVEYFAFARRYPIQTMAYNALAGGLLTGQHAFEGSPEKGSRFDANAMYRRRYWTREMFSRVEQVADVARGEAMSLVELAYAWLASRPGVDSILVGPATRRAPRRRARRDRAPALGRGAQPARRARARVARERHPLCPLELSLAPGTLAGRGRDRRARRYRPLSRARLGEARRGRRRGRARAPSRARERHHDGPRHPRGPLLSARLADRPLRRARLRTRVGGAEPRVSKDREARGRPVLPGLARERGLRARRARRPGGRRRPLPGDALHEERAAAERCCRGTRTEGASGGWTATPSSRSGPRSTTRRRRRAASRCSTAATSAASRRPSGAPSRVTVWTSERADARATRLPARAGEVLLIHNYLWHRSGRNTTGLARRAFTVSYISAATRCTRRRRAPRSFVRVFDRSGVG